MLTYWLSFLRIMLAVGVAGVGFWPALQPAPAQAEPVSAVSPLAPPALQPQVARAPFSATRAMAVDAGSGFTCALDDQNRVWCWGNGKVGQTGWGPSPGFSNPAYLETLPGDAVQVSVGENSACAVLEDGTVWCWGENTSLQLGAPITPTVIE